MLNNPQIRKAVKIHNNRFEAAQISVISPGRVNIIGEHTDYHGGRVFPFAVSKSVFLTGSVAKKGFAIYSEKFGEQLFLDSIEIIDKNHWSRFFSKVIELCQRKNLPIKPFSLVITSDLDDGAGMSSSSALTCGFILFLNHLNNYHLSDDKIISYASIAENSTGVEGGIMDQSCIIKAKENHYVLLDCLTNKIKYHKNRLEDTEWLVINSGVKHELVKSEYNDRKNECLDALILVRKNFGEVKNFRDLNQDHLDHLFKIDQNLFNRLSHFYFEEERVSLTLKAIEQNNLNKLGQILYEGHKSLSKKYDVSCEEIDYLIKLLQKNEAVYGARMFGGGFGGSIIALIKKDQKNIIESSLTKSYEHKFGIKLKAFTVKPSSGAKIILHD